MRRTVRRWTVMMRRRPHTVAAAGAVAGVVILAAAVSCQSFSTARTRAEAVPRASGFRGLTAEPDVRVRIAANVESLELGGPERFEVRPEHGSVRVVAGPVTVVSRASGLRVRDGAGAEQVFAPGEAIEVAGVARPGGETPRIEAQGQVYSGRLRFVPKAAEGSELVESRGAAPGAEAASPPPESAAATMNVIELVPLEPYIAGVISKELWSSWPLGAFEVQSVCARTYALHQRQRAQAAGRAWDLEATVLDQAYGGVTELPTALEAVRRTRGVVLTWQGDFLRAYYSSTCGGRTASAADVWPTGGEYAFNLAAPIQASVREHACQTSPIYTWEVARTRDGLTRQMREWGKINGSPVKAMGTIRSVEALRTNHVGRPSLYRIADDKGRTYTLNAEELRVACNTGAPGAPEVTSKSRVRSGDLEMAFAGEAVTIRGRGFGHGVGMCQYCARGMAERGDGWREMLARFYPGAGIDRAY